LGSLIPLSLVEVSIYGAIWKQDCKLLEEKYVVDTIQVNFIGKDTDI
jgi:hypothetical protein